MWFPLSSVWEQSLLGNEFCRLENNNKKRFRLVAQERSNRIQGYAETACHVHEVDWGRKIISLLFSSTGSHLSSSRCGLSSSLWLPISTFLSFQSTQQSNMNSIWVLQFFCEYMELNFLVTKRYNSLRETWLKMETTMALISNVIYRWTITEEKYGYRILLWYRSVLLAKGYLIVSLPLWKRKTLKLI